MIWSHVEHCREHKDGLFINASTRLRQSILMH
ncbi:hypothetical protein LINPERPRIM_LOCUS12547, partial [Linum perenne]